MMKQRLIHVAGFVIIILFLSICWSVAFFITDFFYSYLNKYPSDFIKQIINSLLGFFIFGCVMFTFSLFNSRQRQKREEFLQSIIDAMKQISRGDYNVNLSKVLGHQNSRDPFSEIVDNINHMAQELGQMEQMRQEFISNVSHEIQSPLTSISGFARALQNDKLSADERMHYLKIIETESQRLSKISDNLLKLTYLESEHHLLEPQQYRLDKQIQDVVLSCEPQWIAKHIEMNLALEEVNIVADKDLLDQVWMNLLNNAIKFTPNGGTISLKACQHNDDLIVQISDTGIGISEEEQLHLFERFYKADKARIRHTNGSGLGLSIVKKIIDMHNGTIHVHSKPNEETIFVISLRTNA